MLMWIAILFQIHWNVTGPKDVINDVSPMSGIANILAERRDGQIILNILDDAVPELTESFTLHIVRVEGGAEISPTDNTSTFSIK